MNIDPWGYIEAELLNYTDGNGVKKEINIIIYSDRVDNGVDNGVDKAQNKFTFKGGMLTDNRAYITIEPYGALSHEIGHIFGLA